MAINTSDEALDAMEKLSPEDQTHVVSALEPHDLDTLHNALTRRAAMRSSPDFGGASFGAPAQGDTSPNMSSAVTGGPVYKPPPGPLPPPATGPFPTFGAVGRAASAVGRAAMSALNTAQDTSAGIQNEILAPDLPQAPSGGVQPDASSAAFAATNPNASPGMPGYGAQGPATPAQTAARIPVPTTPGQLNAARYYTALNPFASTEQLEANPNAQSAAVLSEEQYGKPAAIAGQLVPGMAAQMYLIGKALPELPDIVKPAEAVRPLAAAGVKLLNNALKGGTAGSVLAGVSAALSSPEGERVESGLRAATDPLNFLTGAALGAVHGVGDFAKPEVAADLKGRSSYKRVAALSTDAMDHVADAMAALKGTTDPVTGEPLEPKRNRRVFTSTEQMKVETEPGGLAIQVEPKDIPKPTAVAIVLDGGGTPVARVMGVKPGHPPLWYDLPIDTLAQANEIGDLAHKHKIATTISKVVLDEMYTTPTLLTEKLLMGSKKMLYAGEEARMLAGESPQEPTSPGRPRNKTEKVAAQNPMPDQDAAPVSIASQPAELVANADNAQLKAAGPPAGTVPSAPPAPEHTPGAGPQSPLPAEGPEVGEHVYVSARTEPAIKGKVVGPDPKKAGNWLINFDPTKPAEASSVPQGQLTSQGLAKIQDALPPLRSPVPLPEPGGLAPHQVEEVNTVLRVIEHLQKTGGEGFAQKAMRALVADEWRGPVELAAKVREAQSIRGVAAPDSVYDALTKSMGPQRFRAFDQALVQLQEGKITAAHMEEKFPAEWAKAKGLVESVIREAQDLSRENMELSRGAAGRELNSAREAGTVDQYVARMYRAHWMPKGEWAKIAPENVKRAGVEYLFKKALKASSQWTEAGVAREVLDILNSDDPLGNLAASKMPFTDNFKNLLARGKLPTEIRALMGEETSGSIRLALSLAGQRATNANLKLWREISHNPKYWAPGPTAELQFQVPNNPRYFGDAAGGYTTPFIGEALANLGPAVETNHNFMHSLVGWVKASEVGFSPATVINLMAKNTWHSVLAGGLDPFRPAASGKAFIKSIKVMRDFAANPTEYGNGAIVLEGRRNGALTTGYGESEISPAKRHLIAQDLNKFMNGLPENASLLDIMKATGSKLHELGLKYKSAAGWAHNVIDNQFRLANYIALREQFVSKGMTPEASATLAAERISQSFPNPTRVGTLTTKARSGLTGLFAKYITYFAEDLRIHGSIPKRLVQSALPGSTDPGFKFRMAAATIAAYGFKEAIGAWRRNSGIPDEEVDALQAGRTKAGQAYHPLEMALPWRDSSGRAQFLDLSSTWGPSRLLVGHPDDSMFQRALGGLVMGATEGGAEGEGVRNWLTTTGLIRPVGPQGPPKLVEGEAGVLTALHALWDLGAAPKEPLRLYKAAQKAGWVGAQGRNAEVFTPEQAAAKMAGVNTEGGYTLAPQTPDDPRSPSATAQALEFAKGDEGIGGLARQLKMVMTDPRYASQREARKADILARMKVLAAQQQHIGQLNAAAWKARGR